MCSSRFPHPLSFIAAQAVFIALAVMISITPARAQEEAVKEKKEKTPNFEMDLPVPAGQPVKGIKVPFYGADGTTLQMVLEAEVARRVDDSNIEMDQMKINATSDDGSKMLVEMPQSVFNMETRMLSGEKGVAITRDDFEITGGAGEFDLKSRFGKVIGNVKMIIHDLESLE